ncbi:MAG TPA: glycosyltransferase family 2 protein [Candidatus Acidoferrum sp.]|nr:glycosyltransferase family 2 protein [Candidatus Acidoferrum sp.]
MRVYAVIPVAPFEPESVITKSIECFKELECDTFTFEVHYVIDSFPGDKRDLQWQLPDNFKIMLRNTNRGRRAGAINDFLKEIKDADYVAIFDVDCRPAKDYIVKCVAALEADDSAVLSQGCRVINNMSNVLTKNASLESNFLCELNQFLSRSHNFLAFMGPMVVRGSFLERETFNEEVIDEVFDMLTRMYLKGEVAVLAKTTMGEQAPITLKDLYHQRVRWSRGMVESFSRYFIPMVKAPIPFTRKMSWLSIIIFSTSQFLFSPVVLLRLDKILELSDGPLEFIKLLVGGIGYSCLMTICGFVAISQHITSSKSKRRPLTRSDL